MRCFQLFFLALSGILFCPMAAGDMKGTLPRASQVYLGMSLGALFHPVDLEIGSPQASVYPRWFGESTGAEILLWRCGGGEGGGGCRGWSIGGFAGTLGFQRKEYVLFTAARMWSHTLDRGKNVSSAFSLRVAFLSWIDTLLPSQVLFYPEYTLWFHALWNVVFWMRGSVVGIAYAVQTNPSRERFRSSPALALLWSFSLGFAFWVPWKRVEIPENPP